ncbi:MAG: DUF3301 domain-containing protein [Thermomonas sp.]
MPTLLILMIVGAFAFFFFSSARAAAERAAEIGRDACQAANVQWLDESVHAIGMRLRRNDNGWLGVERSFRFEYSDDGQNRRIGRVVLLGQRLVGFSGPSRAAQAVVQAFPLH